MGNTLSLRTVCGFALSFVALAPAACREDVAGPVIDSFSVTPNRITEGRSAVLRWTSHGATACDIAPDVGPVPPNGEKVVSPRVTTSYKLTCSGNPAVGPAEAVIALAIDNTVDNVQIRSFSASPNPAVQGAPVTLSWGVVNATSCTLNPGSMSASIPTGMTTLTASTSVVLALECQGLGGPQRRIINLTVLPLVRVLSFAAAPTEIFEGDQVTLSFASVHASMCRISPEPGQIARPRVGNVTVTPTVSTVYEFMCTGAGGPVSKTATVTVSRSQINNAVIAISPVGANGTSTAAAVSTTGRFVVYETAATQLMFQRAPGDRDAEPDLILYDRVRDQVLEVVSTNSSEIKGNGPSRRPSISADGRYVAFESRATNLEAAMTMDSVFDIYMRDREMGLTLLLARGNGDSTHAQVSASVRGVVFQSLATNLVTGDTNGQSDIFVANLTGPRIVERVSVGANGAQGSGPMTDPTVSDDANVVAFVGLSTAFTTTATTGNTSIYVRDRMAGTTTRISDETVLASEPAIAGNGRFVAYTARPIAGGPAVVRVFDRQTGSTETVSTTSGGGFANGDSTSASISANGRFVAFTSAASNLVAADGDDTPDVLVRDRMTGMMVLISAGATGVKGNAASSRPAISADGRYVAFESLASNLVANDVNTPLEIMVAPNPLAP